MLPRTFDSNKVYIIRHRSLLDYAADKIQPSFIYHLSTANPHKRKKLRSYDPSLKIKLHPPLIEPSKPGTTNSLERTKQNTQQQITQT